MASQKCPLERLLEDPIFEKLTRLRKWLKL
ncbi:MAG: hypothetical protein ACJAY2_002165 [Pseudomonadales bacterium]|jgi:hypothetical protein